MADVYVFSSCVIACVCRRVPGAGSRDRKWSYDGLDDVIGSPTSASGVVARRRMSSPTHDYDNVFDRRRAGADRPSPSPAVFDGRPPGRTAGAARWPLTDRRAAAAAAVTRPRGSVDERVAVIWNADKSVTMSVPLPDDDVDSKENRRPATQQQQQQQPVPRRHRNESFLMLGSSAVSSARVTSPSPSRGLTHQVSYITYILEVRNIRNRVFVLQ